MAQNTEVLPKEINTECQGSMLTQAPIAGPEISGKLTIFYKKYQRGLGWDIVSAPIIDTSITLTSGPQKMSVYNIKDYNESQKLTGFSGAFMGTMVNSIQK